MQTALDRLTQLAIDDAQIQEFDDDDQPAAFDITVFLMWAEFIAEIIQQIQERCDKQPEDIQELAAKTVAPETRRERRVARRRERYLEIRAERKFGKAHADCHPDKLVNSGLQVVADPANSALVVETAESL